MLVEILKMFVCTHLVRNRFKAGSLDGGGLRRLFYFFYVCCFVSHCDRTLTIR